MDPSRRVKEASGQYQYAELAPTTTFTTSQNATGSRISSGTDSAINKSIDASSLKWTGHFDTTALVGAVSRYALSSCGMAVHPPNETNGLIILDNEHERHLSPLATGSRAPHIRGTSRDLVRSQNDRRALLESVGLSEHSPAAVVLFGDSSEFSNDVVLEFERRLVSLSIGGVIGAVPAELIPSSSVKVERRRAGIFSPGGAGPGPPDDMSFGSPVADDDGAGDGSLRPGPGGAELDAATAREEDFEFVQGVLQRFRDAYDSLRSGGLVLRRLLGANADSDLAIFVKDFGQAKIVAEEFGVAIPSGSSSAAVRREFVASIKSKTAMVMQALRAADQGTSPIPPIRRSVEECHDGHTEYRPIDLTDDYQRPRRGRVDGEVKDMSAKLELIRSVQARITASQMRFKASITLLRKLSPVPIPEKFADLKGLPVSVLMEIDAAMQRQSLLSGLLKKAAHISASAAGGLMARRAALVLDKPDAHFARILQRLVQTGSGLGRLSVLERTYGLIPAESWGFLAALEEYTGTPSADVEELYRAASNASWKDASGQPSVSKDYLAIFELLARVDGEEMEFNVEKVFGSMMQGIERVGVGSIPEWNSLWRTLLTESLRWKASGLTARSALNFGMDLLGKYSLTEATTQQIRSVYSPGGALVAEVSADGFPADPIAAFQERAADMGRAEFDAFDIFQLSQEDKLSGRHCFKCSSPYAYGSDFCPNCKEFKDGTWFCNECDAPTQAAVARHGLCRGHAVNLCTPAGGKARTFRTKPTPQDIQRGTMRHERLLELRKLRASTPGPQHAGGAAGKGKGKGRPRGGRDVARGDRRGGLGDGGSNGRRTGTTGVSVVHHYDGAYDDVDVPELLSESEDEWSDDAEDDHGMYQVGRSADIIEGGTPAQAAFAADVRLACLPRQGVPLLSVHDLDRSLKLVGGYAEVHWGDDSFLYASDGVATLKIPLTRNGAYIELRGDTGCDKAFRIDIKGKEVILVDTGAGISCCGPDCPFLVDAADAPCTMRLVGANKSPLPVSKVGRMRLVFGSPPPYEVGVSFICLTYRNPPALPPLDCSDVFCVSGVGVAAANDLSIPPLMATIHGVRALHARFGVVDPRVFERLHDVAIGVEKVGRRARDRFLSLPYVRAAQQRTRVASASGGSHRKQAAPGMRCSLDLTRRFLPDTDGWTCSALFLDEATNYLWEGPMVDHSCSEFVRVLADYRRFVRTHFCSELAVVRTDCDPSFTVNHHGATRNTAELQRYLDESLPAVEFEHSPPHTQAMNPVEGVARHLYHLVNFYLERSLLSPLAWHDMLMAAVWTINRLPHPSSSDPSLRMSTAFEKSKGAKPDLSLMRFAPGALVGCLRVGSKSSSLGPVSELGYMVCPDPASSACLVRSFKDGALFATIHLQALCEDEILRVVAARHAIGSGLMRERSGLAEIPAATVAADALRLLEERRASGLPTNSDELVIIMDPLTGRPAKLEHVFVDGRLALLDAAADAVAPTAASASTQPQQSAALPAPVPAPALEVAAPVPPVTSPPLELLAPNIVGRKVISGVGLRGWFRSLPSSTRMEFAPNPKSGESARRYERYSAATSLGAYRALNTASRFQYPDLINDFQRGFVKLPAIDPPVAIGWVSGVEDGPDVPTADPLDELVRDLRDVSPPLDKALKFEELEGFSPSPPVAGGGLNSVLAVEGYCTFRRLEGDPIDFAHDPEASLVVLTDSPDGGYEDKPYPGVPAPLLVGSVGLTEFKSVRALRLHSGDWEGWKKVIAPELHNVVHVKRAMQYKSYADFKAARATYGDRLEIVFLVTPAVVKHDANGKVLRLKWRLTAGDRKNNTNSLFDGATYSGAVDDSFVRFIANLTLGRPNGRRRVVDVKGAYFEGSQRSPDEGGRIIWAPVPPGWDEFGFAEFDADGRRNWFHISGNLPGLRNAGREWQRVNDEFLSGLGFEQSIIDRRIFFRHGSAGNLFIICVYVDDYWTYCEDDDEWDVFYKHWSTRFVPSDSVVQAADDFCGVNYTPESGGCLGARSLKLLVALQQMLAPFERPRSCDTPMDPAVVPLLSASPSESNPLLPDRVGAARSILGLGMYVVRGTRPDGLFAATALAPFVVVNLTRVVWSALLRWAHYLVDTRETRLLLRPVPPDLPLAFVACSDSSSINYPLPGVPELAEVPVASMGGFSLFFPGSGSFLSECRSPKHLTDSSAGAELNIASWAGKAIIPFRMLQAELRLGPVCPTILEIDASALLDSIAMDKISRKQRFQAARLAMLRLWQSEGIISLHKEKSSAMRADVLSKAMAPAAAFHRCARLLLSGSAEFGDM